MTRKERWQVEGPALMLLRHVESCGYVVSVHRLGPTLLGRPGFVETVIGRRRSRGQRSALR